MKRVILLGCVLGFFGFGFFGLVQAVSLSETEAEINQLENKISLLKTQAKSLTGQISYYDSQISLSLLKISQTETQIAAINQKITALEEDLTYKAKVLTNQIVQSYKQGSHSNLKLFFSANSFGDILKRIKYTQLAQNQTRKNLHDTQVTQVAYAQTRATFEEAKLRLEKQKIELAENKKAREILLKETNNSQVAYEQQLKRAHLELEAIKNAIASGVVNGPVKLGDPIAIMGNSGYPNCSTGAHLHFEMQQNGAWVNAETYLRNMTDKNGLRIGSGSWAWPMKGTIEVTQRYGKTPYSYRYTYSGEIHTGIDMVSDNSQIYAVADGILYSSTQACGSSTIKIKYIDHGSGLKSFYLHVM